MLFKFVYRNDRTPDNEDKRVCKLCDRKLDYTENCMEREKVTLCYNCVHDVRNSYQDITTDRR